MSTDMNKRTELNKRPEPGTPAEATLVVAGPRTKTELRADATRARADLAQTLDALEYKLNLPKQLRYRSRLARVRLRTLGEENPLALAGIAVAAAITAGVAVWLGVKAVQRR
jgi:hypothetical protein